MWSMNKHLKIFLVLFSSLLLSFDTDFLSNEDYITGDDGVIRMYVNIIGHVKSPGTYLVYDGIDFMTAISNAGGYLPGANLKNIKIYKSNGSLIDINLNQLMKNKSEFDSVILSPHDTILIEQKKMSRIFLSSNLPGLIISMVNLAITLKNAD